MDTGIQTGQLALEEKKMSNRFVSPVVEPDDSKGRSLPAAELFFYEAGTVTPRATYADCDLTIQNPHPVVADKGGRFPDIFLEQGLYRVQLYDRNGVLIWDRDDVAGISAFDASTTTQLQTASNGQTVFTVQQYVVGVNSIAVFINGVRQNDGDYTETNSTTITFDEGLDEGDEVYTVVVQFNSLPGTTSASNVTYNSTNVQLKLDASEITTSQINTTNLENINQITSTGFSTTGDEGGATWIYTGNNIPGNAGTTDYPNGIIYDSLGTEFKVYPFGTETQLRFDGTSLPAYTITNNTDVRTLDATAATLTDTINTLTALITDLKDKGVIN